MHWSQKKHKNMNFCISHTQKSKIIKTLESIAPASIFLTCTFATTAEVIRQDQKIWKLFCPGTHPNDFQSFLALGSRGRTLATSLPGKATHTEKPWISPFFNHNFS